MYETRNVNTDLQDTVHYTVGMLKSKNVKLSFSEFFFRIDSVPLLALSIRKLLLFSIFYLLCIYYRQNNEVTCWEGYNTNNDPEGA